MVSTCRCGPEGFESSGSASESTFADAWVLMSETLVSLFDKLIHSYEPVTANPRSSLGGCGAMKKWIDPSEVPASQVGTVVAVQLARTPSGFGTVARGAKCCLRTPRPHLENGGNGARRMLWLPTNWRVPAAGLRMTGTALSIFGTGPGYAIPIFLFLFLGIKFVGSLLASCQS